MTQLSPDLFHVYQDDSVTELYEHPRMLAILPTGAGKTIVSLTAFAELKRDGVVRQGIVLGPKRVANSVWPNEAHKWTHTDTIEVYALTGTDKQREKKLQDKTVDLFSLGLANIAWLVQVTDKWNKDDPRFDILIVDEVSCCKDPRGSWAKALRKLCKRFKNVWLLTGTPRPNSDLNYFVYMSALTNDKLWGKSFDKWRREYFYPTDYQQRVWEPHRHMLPDLRAAVAARSFKVPMSAVPRPASDPIVHKVQLPAKARAYYKKMERELFATVDGTDILAFNEAVSTGKLAQIAQGFLYDDEKEALPIHHAKSEMLEHLLQYNGGDASVILYHFNEDLRRMQDVCPGLVYLGAGVSDKRALEIEAEWNAGNIEHLGLHPFSAGHGLNLQGTPSQLINYALTWSAEYYAQAIARVARQGYVGTTGQEEWMVLNHCIVAEDTVDEAKMLRVRGKLRAEQIALEYVKSVRV